MANLLEAYKGRIAVAENYYAQNNGGARLSNTRKMITAQCLKNTATLINEAFVSSTSATQRGNMGSFKRFCMDISTVVVPNLVVNDMLMTVPMASWQGYVTYLEFGLGEEKGGVGGSTGSGDEFEFKTIAANPFGLGDQTAGRFDYTGQRVVETIAAADTTFKPAWTPVVNGKVSAHYKTTPSSGEEWVELDLDSEGKITFVAGTYDKVRYVYDNVVIPAAKLPTLVARMKGVALQAKARRIAIQYSQLAALQAKQDYGVDFESTIAQQAQAELQYEIDNEAATMLMDAADSAIAAGTIENVTWVDELSDALAYSLKAEGFARAIEKVKANMFKRTAKVMPTFMLVGPEVMPILTFVPGFKASSSARAAGPYIAGDINGLKVIVSPKSDKACYFGVLAGDGKTATGVFAPYVPLLPTQLLGYADGTMSQGWCSLYDMRILNSALTGKITITEGDDAIAVKVVNSSETI